MLIVHLPEEKIGTSDYRRNWTWLVNGLEECTLGTPLEQ